MRVSSEGARGCGYRQPGGLYLCSDGVGLGCELLPVPMEVCPCCGGGIKPARGWTWVSPDGLLPHHTEPVAIEGKQVGTSTHAGGKPHRGCPLNKPGLLGERAGLIWIGEVYYPTPESWVAEGKAMGFSRRISAVPQGYVAGETWVLVGHRKAIQEGLVCTKPDEYKGTKARNFEEAEAIAEPWPVPSAEWADAYVPAIFHLWLPERLEYVVKGDETEDELQALAERGIEPVQVIEVHEPGDQAALA